MMSQRLPAKQWFQKRHTHKTKVPVDSAMQIGKLLALKPVYASPEQSTLDAIAEVAKPRPKV